MFEARGQEEERAWESANLLDHSFWNEMIRIMNRQGTRKTQLERFWPEDGEGPQAFEDHLNSQLFLGPVLDKAPLSFKTAMGYGAGAFLGSMLWFAWVLPMLLDFHAPKIVLVIVSIVALLAMSALVVYGLYRLSPPPLRYAIQKGIEKIKKNISKKQLMFLAALLMFVLIPLFQDKHLLDKLAVAAALLLQAAPILGITFGVLIAASILCKIVSRCVSREFLLNHPWLVMDFKKKEQFDLLAPEEGHTSFVRCFRDKENPNKIMDWFACTEGLKTYDWYDKPAGRTNLMCSQWEAVRKGLTVSSPLALNCLPAELNVRASWTKLTQGIVDVVFEDDITLRLHLFNQAVIGLDPGLRASPNDGITWVERLHYVRKTMLCKRYAPELAWQKVVSDHGIRPDEQIKLSEMGTALEAEAEAEKTKDAVNKVQATWTELEEAVNDSVAVQDDSLIKEAVVEAFSNAVNELQVAAKNNGSLSETLHEDLKSVKAKWAGRLKSIRKLQVEVKAWQASAAEGVAAGGTHALPPPPPLGDGGAAWRPGHEPRGIFPPPYDLDEEDEDETKEGGSGSRPR